MWICLNDGFFSIIAECNSDKLLVRARLAGDIERVFAEPMKAEGATITVTPDRDYRFRAVLSRQAVAGVLSARAQGIDYNNFKDSVDDEILHEMYEDFWDVARTAQQASASTRE